MTINLTNPIFTDEAKARAHFEAIRWPEAVSCVHCGGMERVYKLEDSAKHRAGLFHCNDCNGQFTVTTGSVMESSHLPLNKWALGFHLMAASKKGVSALQLKRMLGVTYKSAWFMAHRIREAMRDTSGSKLGGEGQTVEADETYVGGKPRKGGRKSADGRGTKKTPVVALVERGGRVRARVTADAKSSTLAKLIRENVDRRSKLMTDEWRPYITVGKEMQGGHARVSHGAGEYARTDGAHVNNAEAFFALLKRGIVGSFHHVSEQHLDRYCDEFAFRWGLRHVDDTTRAAEAVKNGQGKRLTYRRAGSTSEA